MRKLLEKSNYLVLVAVFSSLLASVAAFVWGAVKSVKVIIDIIRHIGSESNFIVPLIEVMDIFLIATVLFIFALGVYELFIGKLSLPEWLVIRNLHDLKVKLSSVVIMVMGIHFLKHLVEWQDPMGTLLFGLSVAVVSAALIAFSFVGSKNE